MKFLETYQGACVEYQEALMEYQQAFREYQLDLLEYQEALVDHQKTLMEYQEAVMEYPEAHMEHQEACVCPCTYIRLVFGHGHTSVIMPGVMCPHASHKPLSDNWMSSVFRLYTPPNKHLMSSFNKELNKDNDECITAHIWARFPRAFGK